MPRNERLRQQRILYNWRQQDLADKLEITVLTIQRWERGAQQPSLYYRAKLCALFGRTAWELGLVEDDRARSVSEVSMTPDPEQQQSVFSTQRRLWMVPHARNAVFTGRDTLLEQLTTHFFSQRRDLSPLEYQSGLPQILALTGLGGIGKTQLALEYAYRAHEQGRYAYTLWINAANEESILQSYSKLADLMPAFPSLMEAGQGKRAQAGICWLEESAQPWLLIADNVDNLELIQRYLPARGAGHILLTTRASAVSAVAHSLEVGIMDVLEGTQLLLRRTQQTSASEDVINEATNLTVALGQLPLALDQAGAYIEETGCSIREYRHLYQQHSYTLLARRGGQHANHPDSVVTTWSLSFEQIEQRDPAAAELLQLCAFLAPEHISEDLLISGAPHWPAALRKAVANRFSFNQLFRTLLAFSLVKRLPEESLLSVHRLVQLVQMERLTPEQRRQWHERLMNAGHFNTVPDEQYLAVAM